MLKQPSEGLGQAHWCDPELQLPHAPPPALPHGPQEAPQQNHDISPYAAEPLLEQPIAVSVRWTFDGGGRDRPARVPLMVKKESFVVNKRVKTSFLQSKGGSVSRKALPASSPA